MRTSLVAFYGLCLFAIGPAFCQSGSSDGPKSAPRPWPYGPYDKLAVPQNPSALEIEHPEPLQRKSVIIYRGVQAETVNVGVTNNLAPVKPASRTK
jgi:hypothetical protein